MFSDMIPNIKVSEEDIAKVLYFLYNIPHIFIFSECNNDAVSTPTSPFKDLSSTTRTNFSESISGDSG